MNFRAGIVGCGRIGSEFSDSHAGAYKSVSEVELVALSDLDEDKLKKAGKRWSITFTSLYSDYEEMLSREALDILSICTWNSTHLEIAGEAVNSGVKAIYCEKPIADTLQKADKMIQLCNEKGVILQVNHQRRFNRRYQEVKDFIRKGKLGRMQQVNFYYTRGIANTGSHMFDLLRFFFGDADWVQAARSPHESHDPYDPNIDGDIKLGSGLLCKIEARDDQSITVFDMEFIGTGRRLHIINNGSKVEYYEVEEGKPRLGSLPFNTDIPKNSMVNAVEHLIECLKERKESISSGEDGRAALELICAFHESASDEGKRIVLPLKDSKIEIKSR